MAVGPKPNKNRNLVPSYICQDEKASQRMSNAVKLYSYSLDFSLVVAGIGAVG
mgnify:CR=1 FL=1